MRVRSIACILVFALSGCSPIAKEEIYLIPEDYLGWLVVLPNRVEGEQKEFENGLQVYRFPTSGVLKTRYDLNYKPFKPTFFQLSSSGERKEIMYEKFVDSGIPEGEVYVMFGTTGSNSALPYEKYDVGYVMIKGREEILERQNLEDFLKAYAKDNGDI